MSDFWQITYEGVTKSCDDWGISSIKRKRHAPVDTDIASFSLDGAPFDSVPLFAWLKPLLILRDGQPWFSGVVTKPQPKGTPKKEMINYQVSGPWYWLEKIVFQQQWAQVSLSGMALVTSSTTQSETILGQSIDGVKMNSGQVIREVLIYAQYAYQMIPFPKTVDVNHLPPSPPTADPFIIGTIDVDITIPYMSVRDKSCADIIRQMLKYSPDAVTWFDYSTNPPTINIGKRANLASKTITLFPSPDSGLPKLANAFDPTPRYDLQVPVVVVKFLETNSINGKSYAQTTVQVYPPAPPGIDHEAWASQPRAWIQTIDLIGGNTTTQSASINTKVRPVTPASVIALPWALSKQPFLTATKTIPYQDVGAPVYDTANMKVDFINTTIDPDDPLNKPSQNPNNITVNGAAPPGDCVQLVNELLPGGFPNWLQDDPNDLDKAKVTIECHLKYDGTDAATQTLFWQDPTDPSIVITDGSGVYIFYWTGLVTNADTDTYTELTSRQGGEPVPAGFAQYLYNCLKDLHFEGELTIIEQECSDVLPCGCVFNTNDGNPDWQSANMLVLSTQEDVDSGTTSVQFGPPAFLTLDEMEKLFRVNLGVFPAYKLQQRTTGELASGSNVIGAEHGADTHVVNPPTAPITVQLGPFAVSTRKNPDDPTGNTFQVKVEENGVFLNKDGSNVTVTGTGVWRNLNANDTGWIEGDVVGYACSTVAAKNYGNGDTGYTTSAYWITGGLTEDDGGTTKNQTKLRKVLFVFIPDSNGKPMLQTQQTTTNLQMQSSFATSEPMIYPFPI